MILHEEKTFYPKLLFHVLTVIATFQTISGIRQPDDCRFLNPIGETQASIDLVNYFYNSTSFFFNETNFFQSQCLLCETVSRQVCYGHNFGASYGLGSGKLTSVQLVGNLPLLYSLADPIGKNRTTVTLSFALQSDMLIPYRTLLRFKGVANIDPVVNLKPIVLWLVAKCLPNDQNSYIIDFGGSVFDLTVHLFVNSIQVNLTNGIHINGKLPVTVNCSNQQARRTSLVALPSDVPCTAGSCLGSEFCLTYRPEYAASRETWCPLTRNNWISTPNNALTLNSADLVLPLHIHVQRELVFEINFRFTLNPDWFIRYPGIMTISIPETTDDQFFNRIWRITLPATSERPLNRRTVLLFNCSNVQIRYNASNVNNLEATMLFIDMKSNFSFSFRNNIDEAKERCNSNILVPLIDSSSSTTRQNPQSNPNSTTSITTPWYQNGANTIVNNFLIYSIFFHGLYEFLYNFID